MILKKRLDIKRLAFYSWTGVVFFLLTYNFGPSAPIEKFNDVDKLIHFFLFGIFAVLFVIAFRDTRKSVYLKGLIAALSYSLLMEFVQVVLPWRAFSMLDVIAGFWGAAVFIIPAKLVYDD